MNNIDTSYQFIVTALQPYSHEERKQMAALLGIGESSIAKIRDGRNTNPTRKLMSKLHDHLVNYPRTNSVGQGANSEQPEVFYGVDKGMSPAYQQVPKEFISKPQVGAEQRRILAVTTFPEM